MSYYPPSTVVPIYIAFMTTGIILLVLRFWARFKSRAAFSVDDVFAVAGVVTVSTCTAIQLHKIYNGANGSVLSPEKQMERVVTGRQVNIAMTIVEVIAVACIKLSLLYFFRRIFGVWDRVRRAMDMAIWIIVVWAAVFFIAQITICGANIRYQWDFDQTIALRNCGDKGLLLLIFGVTSVLTDLLVLALPLACIHKLQMPARRKYVLSFVVLLGALSTLAALLRTVFLCIAYPMGRMQWAWKAPEDDKKPLVLQLFDPSFWIMVEMWIGSWVSNLLALKPLFLAMDMGGRFRTLRRKASGIYELGSHRGSKSHEPESTEVLDAHSDAAPIMKLSHSGSRGGGVRDVEASSVSERGQSRNG